ELELVLLLLELDLVRDRPDCRRTLLTLKLEDARLRSLDQLGEVVNVAAGVPALGRRLPQRTGDDRVREVVHLDAAVVDVELAGDLGAGSAEHPADRIAQDGPPGVTEVQRSGRVRRDELDVDLLAAEHVRGAVRVPRLDDRGGDGPLGAGG